MSSFMTRLCSSAVLMLITVPCLVFGGMALWCLLTLASLVGMHELYRACGFAREKWTPAAYAGAVLVLLAHGLKPALLPLALAAACLLLLSVFVLAFPRIEFKALAEAMFGVIYLPYMLGCIYRIRALEGGAVLVWLVFATSWGSDVFAYVSGLLLGRHRLAPVLSPKKSVEGSVGAVLGTGLLCVLLSVLFPEELSFLSPAVPACFVLGAAGSAISQLGDLAASAIKRQKGIKDYGTLIPGHGGILDRFDSVIVTAPVIYGLLLLWL